MWILNIIHLYIQLPEATPPPCLYCLAEHLSSESTSQAISNRNNTSTSNLLLLRLLLLTRSIHQNSLKNLPSWDNKSLTNQSKFIKKSRKICLGRSLGGVLGGPGAILAPRPAQGRQKPRKSISGAPLGDQFWKPKSSQNWFFGVPRGVNFISNFLIGRRSIFLGI